MAETKEQKTVTLLNRGQRAFHITAGGKPVVMKPNTTVTLTEDEAKVLTGYPEIVDIAKIAPKQTEQVNKLKAENEALKSELEEAKKGQGSESSKKDQKQGK